MLDVVTLWLFLYLQVYISTCSVVNALKIHFKARSKIVRGKTCTQRTGQRLVWQMICSILSLFISSVVTGNLSPSSNKSVFRLRHLTRKIFSKLVNLSLYSVYDRDEKCTSLLLAGRTRKFVLEINNQNQ